MFMKVFFTSLFLFCSASSFAQNQLTVFYFGASDCGPCSRPEVIQSINKINAEIDSVYKNSNVKLVMVTIDSNRKEAIKYITKYDSWDEFSMGSRYKNELAMSHLNEAEIPGLPHIIISEDEFAESGYGTTTLKQRRHVKSIMGGVEIVGWVNSGMKLD